MGGPVVRLAGVCALLGLAGLLALHYGATAPANDPYVTGQELTSEPAAHVGEQTYVWGRVVDVGNDGIVIAVEGERVRVSGTTADATVGDAVQVYGTVRRDGSVAADRVVVSERDALERMYAVSALGGLLAAAGTLRYWRVDLRRVRVEARDR